MAAIDARPAVDLDAKAQEMDRFVRELPARLRAAGDLDELLVRAIATESEDVLQRVSRRERYFLLVGSAAARTAFLDRLVGATVFAESRRVTRSVVEVRRGAEHDYVARLTNGIEERFVTCLPDRTSAFDKALARATRERDEARGAEASLAASVDVARRTPAEPVPPVASEPHRVQRSLWQRFVFWLLMLFGRKVQPALPMRAPLPSMEDGPTRVLPATLVQLEAVRHEAEARLKIAEEHLSLLETDRARYADERRETFFDSLQELACDFARGGEVAALRISVPQAALPEDVVIVEADGELERCPHVDGVVVLSRPGELDDSPIPLRQGLSSIRLATDASAERVARKLESGRDHARTAAIADAATRARDFIARVLLDVTRCEQTSSERVAAVERQRLDDPAVFRARVVARIETTVVDALRDLERVARAELDERLESLRGEWHAKIVGAADRSALERAMRQIDATSKERLGEIIMATNGAVTRQATRGSEALRHWLDDEIRGRYHLVAREHPEDEAALLLVPRVIDREVESSAPLTGVREAFEEQRVGYGLGGAAAGAVVGTIVLPVVGTAIGAFFGVFAGFLKGAESLRHDCLRRLEATMDRVEADLRSQLDQRRSALEVTLRTTAIEALDRAMSRFERSIARLLEIERTVLEAERAKSTRLAELRRALEADDVCAEELAASLRKRLATRAATRSAPSFSGITIEVGA